MEGWAGFTNDMQRYYGVHMDCLNDAFHEEQKQYYHQTSAWADVSPQQLAGRPWCFKQYDLLKVTQQEIIDSFKVQLSVLPNLQRQDPAVSGCCGRLMGLARMFHSFYPEQFTASYSFQCIPRGLKHELKGADCS